VESGFVIARVIIAAIISVGLTLPASARSYYVVQDVKTHKCSVLPKKPKSKKVVLVKGSLVYKSRAEAHTALRTFAVCKS
jgi:predicted CoA-binding protein